MPKSLFDKVADSKPAATVLKKIDFGAGVLLQFWRNFNRSFFI